MKNNWIVRTPGTAGVNSVNSLVATRGSSVLNKLFTARAHLDICVSEGMQGIWSADNLEIYEPAITAILEHLRAGKPILIYGDSDVDGITATVAMETVLLTVSNDPTGQIHVLIPDRVHRGYGIKSKDIVEFTSCTQYKPNDWLIVTVDCGTNDVEPVTELKALGFNIIITDHHLSEGELPQDIILINPKLSMKEEDEEYVVSGCYISAKIAAHVFLRTKLRECAKSDVLNVNRAKFLDALVAISILSDQISINKLCRKQYKTGINAMVSSFLGGLSILLGTCWWSEGTPISSTLLSYSVIPRLNSAGRMGNPMLAYNLLSVRDFILSDMATTDVRTVMTQKGKLANKITELNQSRKSLEHELSDKINNEVDIAKTADKNNYSKSIVINIPNSEPGILGIVAAQFCDRYKVPVLILTEIDGELKGSGRSPAGYDLHGLLKSCESILTGCGGHRVAAGLSLKPDNFEEFKKLFDKKIDEHEKVTVNTEYDAEIKISELYDARIPLGIPYVEPIGNGNTAPTFLLKKVKIISEYMKREVLTLIVLDEESNSTISVTRYRPPFGIRKYSGRTADMLVEYTVSYFGGVTIPEYRLLDIDIYADKALDNMEKYEEQMMKSL